MALASGRVTPLPVDTTEWGACGKLQTEINAGRRESSRRGQKAHSAEVVRTIRGLEKRGKNAEDKKSMKRKSR